MAIKITRNVEPNTPAILTKRIYGKLEVFKLADELRENAAKYLGYGGEEEFLEWLGEQDMEFGLFYPEPFSDGIVLENSHIDGIRKGLDNDWSIDISWENERPFIASEWAGEEE